MPLTTSHIDAGACALFLVLAFALAGTAQVAWLASRFSRWFALPLDGGLTFRGRRIFGANKTLAGLVVMVPATSLAFVLVAWLIEGGPRLDGQLWPLTLSGYAALGAAAGLGFMLGELPNSFIKRQLDIPPGARSDNPRIARWQFVADRLDSGIGMLVALSVVAPVPLGTWLLVLSLGWAIHWSFSAALVSLRKSPGSDLYFLRSRKSRSDPPDVDVVPLALATDPQRFGGKAWNLSRLIALGQPVPEGFAIAAGVEETGHDLDLAVLALPADTLIVRSSAVGEDSSEASFAGLLESIPNVHGPAAVRDAVRRVQASRWSSRALAYERHRGVAITGVGVIVQRQIDSVLSGVLFTCSPEDDRQMLVEYCVGSGEKLVSGRVDPFRLSIGRNDLRCELGGTLDASHTVFLPSQETLTQLARRAMEIEHAFGCAQDIEWTIDAEGRLWIVQARPITAPIRLASRARVRWSNANVNENFPEPISPLLYSVARVGYYHYFRNLALAFGLSRRRVAEMEQPLRHIIGVHGARMYYNLTSIHGLLRSAPFGDLLTAWFNQFVGSEDTDTPAIAQRSRTSINRFTDRLQQVAELFVIASKTMWRSLFVTPGIARFERTVDAFAARTQPELLAAKPTHALLEDLRGFVDIRNHRWLDASLADTGAMVSYGALRFWIGRALPGDDNSSIHNNLLKALPNLPSSMPALELWHIAQRVRDDSRLTAMFSAAPADAIVQSIRNDQRFEAFARAFDRYLNDWGFRCSGELLLTVKSFQENPAALVEIIRAYLASDTASPADHLSVQLARRLDETRRVASRLSKRRLFRFVPFLHEWHVGAALLAWTQSSIVLRERARLKQALLYSRLRRIALAIGARLAAEGRLERPDDVFFLEVNELDDALAGYAMFPDHLRRLVAVRRQAHLDVTATTPPSSLDLDGGEYYSAHGNDTRDDKRDDVQSDGTLKGLGVCGGRVTARAAVLDNVTEAHRLQPGDVLVTRQTDPGWAAVFPLVSGLVIERGGMLSHGAIIAREFGIPSVVGIASATCVIQHGSTISVDGDRGLVTLVRRDDTQLDVRVSELPDLRASELPVLRERQPS